MAVLQTLIENTYSAIEGARAPAGLLSDGNVMVVVRKANGANWDYEIQFSDDGGSTWTLKLGFLSNANGNLYTRLIGDKLYCVMGTSTVNTALAFYRVDYTPATKSFSLAVNGTTIRSAIATEYFGVPGLGRESSSGRLWCGYIYGGSTFRRLSASYSDNDGSSWSTTTLAHECGVTSPHVGVACLEYKTLMTIGGVAAGNYQIFCATRNHSDGTNVWSALSQAIDTYDGTTPYSYLSQESASPAKRALVVAWDQASGTPQKLYARRVVEDGAGNLAWGTTQTVTCPAGESGFIWPSGRTDGFEVFYLYSGSLGTARIRRYGNSDTNWQSESPVALSPSTRSDAACQPPYDMACAMGAKLLLLSGTGTAGSYRPYAICKNLATTFTLLVSQLAPIEFLHSVAPTGTMRIEWQGLATMGAGQSLPFDSIGFVAPMAVRLPIGFGGFVGIERVLEFGVLGSVRQTTTIPLDAMGILNAIYHQWFVQRYTVDEFLHLWQVLQRASVGQLPHSWTVLTEQDPDFPHLWRVIEPQLVVLHGQDIQLPFGKIEKVG